MSNAFIKLFGNETSHGAVYLWKKRMWLNFWDYIIELGYKMKRKGVK